MVQVSVGLVSLTEGDTVQCECKMIQLQVCLTIVPNTNSVVVFYFYYYFFFFTWLDFILQSNGQLVN